MNTRVVHCKRDSYDVLIDRTTIWGNPFKINTECTREESIARHRRWFLHSPKAAHLREQIHELRDRVLGCWCKTEREPNRPCHGDTLADFADGRISNITMN